MMFAVILLTRNGALAVSGRTEHKCAMQMVIQQTEQKPVKPHAHVPT